MSTSAGLLGGYQAGQCQAQLEGLLLCLGIKQAERFLPFAAEYASCLAYIKQVEADTPLNLLLGIQGEG